MKINRGLNSKTFSNSQSFQSYAEDTLILPPSLRENLNFIEYVGRRVSEHGGVTGQMSTPAPSHWGTGTTWTSWPPCSRASSAGPRATTNGPARWGRRWSKYAWNYCLKKKIVIAEEDNFFKQRMTSSSANTISWNKKCSTSSKVTDLLSGLATSGRVWRCERQAVHGGERAGWTRVAGRNIDLLVEYWSFSWKRGKTGMICGNMKKHLRTIHGRLNHGRHDLL